MKIYDQHILNIMTQAQCREWLIENDKEGATYWSSLPLDSDFKECVQENINDFGFQE